MSYSVPARVCMHMLALHCACVRTAGRGIAACLTWNVVAMLIPHQGTVPEGKIISYLDPWQPGVFSVL